MKKENEKLKKINKSQTKNVSGGEVDKNPLTGKFDVYDNETHKRVAYDMSEEDAKYIDFVYNNREDIEQRANGVKSK